MAKPDGNCDIIHRLWAGCAKTAKSTSGGIVCIGEHVIKTYSRQQRVIALSSAEAELYAMVAASAESLAIIAYAKDLGNKMTGEVYVDSSAALGISQRCGIDKVRHLRTQGLWVQEARLTGRLAYRKVLGSSTSLPSCCRNISRRYARRSVAAEPRQLQSSTVSNPSCWKSRKMTNSESRSESRAGQAADAEELAVWPA